MVKQNHAQICAKFSFLIICQLKLCQMSNFMIAYMWECEMCYLRCSPCKRIAHKHVVKQTLAV